MYFNLKIKDHCYRFISVQRNKASFSLLSKCQAVKKLTFLKICKVHHLQLYFDFITKLFCWTLCTQSKAMYVETNNFWPKCLIVLLSTLLYQSINCFQKKNESPKEDLACTFFLSYFLGKILQVSKALKNWDTAFKYALVKYQTYLWLWHVSKHLSLLGKRLVKVLLYLSRTENHLTLQRCNLPWILLD